MSYLTDWVQFSTPTHKFQPTTNQSFYTPQRPGPTSRLFSATEQADVDYPLDPALEYSPANGDPYKFSPYKTPGGKAVHEPLFLPEILARVQEFVGKHAPDGVSGFSDVAAHHAVYALILAERGHRGPFLLAGEIAIDIDLSRGPKEDCRLVAKLDRDQNVWVSPNNSFDVSKCVDLFQVINKENERDSRPWSASGPIKTEN